MLKETQPFRDQHRKEIFLKAFGQPLGTAKGYRKAVRKFPKAIGKPLGNSFRV
jgi:hypothetical protein